MDEKQAIQRLKQGDLSGMEFLVACHQVRAVRAAYFITRDLGLAEDVVQDAFIQVYRSVHRFDEGRPFAPWFLRSVVNASVKTMQRSSRQLPLALIPAPEGFATPAVEVGATFVAGGPSFDVPPTPTLETELTPFEADPLFPNTPTPVPNGSGLYLDRVIELPDSFILVGNFTDAGDLPGPFLPTTSAYDYVPKIEDEDGNSVEFKIRDDIKPVVTWASVYYWAYEIAKPVHGPLKITLDEITIDSLDTVRFDFDSGPNPQPGQIWQLDLPIQLGQYDYVVDSAERLEDGYVFRFHSGVGVPEGTSFILDIVGSSQERGPAGGEEDRRPKDLVKYSQSITYLVPPPTGQLTVELTLFESIPLQGPWTLTWIPPNK